MLSMLALPPSEERPPGSSSRASDCRPTRGAHLRADLGQGLGQKMRRPHPGLDGSERVFDRLPTNLHLFRRLIEAFLHDVQHSLVFPPLDAPFFAGRAFGFDRTALAGRGPINI
jgi:hypothetical protein